MRKILTLAAVALMSLAAQAQTEHKALYESKNYDNWYIGVNGGLSTKTNHNKWLDNLNSNAGLRVGHWFTPTFGLAVDGNAYFGDKPQPDTHTMVKYANGSLAATINIGNWWFGYEGEPRFFEVIAVPALGMGHVFTSRDDIPHGLNDMTAKLAMDFAFNVDKKKSLQIYLEPALLYSVTGNACGPDQPFGLDINRSHFQLNLGVAYKFKNTNGSHNFKYAEPEYITDQAEINRLNGRINELLEENAALKNRPEMTIAPKMVYVETNQDNLEPVIIFKQNSFLVDPLQFANIERVAKYLKENEEYSVEVIGYASTEGNAEYNQQLSMRRAQAVCNALVDKYGINAERVLVKANGATDKLSDDRRFNRIVKINLVGTN